MDVACDADGRGCQPRKSSTAGELQIDSRGDIDGAITEQPKSGKTTQSYQIRGHQQILPGVGRDCVTGIKPRRQAGYRFADKNVSSAKIGCFGSIYFLARLADYERAAFWHLGFRSLQRSGDCARL